MNNVSTSQNLSPPTPLLNKVLEEYNNKNYKEAENLAISISNNFPKNQFIWKVLGLIYDQTNRASEAIIAHKKAVKINPEDAEALNNLGIALQNLGLYSEAKESYQKAIFLNNNFSLAYNNLALVLIKQGKLNDAKINCKKAIKLNPNLALAYNTFGNIMHEIGKLNEAKNYYNKAIELKSDYADAYHNIGTVYLKLNKEDEAEISFSKAITFNPRHISSIVSLSVILDYKNQLDETKFFLKKIIELDPDNFGLRAGVHLAILKFLDDDFSFSKSLLIKAQNIKEKSSNDKIYKNEKKYFDYLLKLLNWRNSKIIENNELINKKEIYVIGESHALVSHRINFTSVDGDFTCRSFLIQGCKQFHLGNNNINKFKTKFNNIFNSLPNSSDVLLCFGEIDCRLDSGIISHKNKYKHNDIQSLIKTTIKNFLNYIFKINMYSNHKIIIQGVPCPNIDIKEVSTDKIRELIDVISQFNIELKNESKNLNFGFLDVYKLTNRGDGLSNDIWHLDNHHLSPEGMQEAWKEYYFC